jgi:hypothetical protein
MMQLIIIWNTVHKENLIFKFLDTDFPNSELCFSAEALCFVKFGR